MLILRNRIESRAHCPCSTALSSRCFRPFPKRVVRKLSSRYIAGSELEDARRVVAELNADGKLATVDVLGEEVADETEAAAIAAEYVAALDAFERDDLDANVSIKPTGLGLKLGYDLCKRNVEAVIAAAEPTNRFVRIDMEDSSTTDDTLRLFRELRDKGHGQVGLVLQACARRTVADAASLAGGERPALQGDLRRAPSRSSSATTRRCGPASSGRWTTLLGRRLLRGDRDARRVARRGVAPPVRERARPRIAYEFQMLLGVRPELGDRIVAGGHRLRIYVPYGRQWYEYSLRRLQENPKIAGYVAGDLGRSLFRRR